MLRCVAVHPYARAAAEEGEEVRVHQVCQRPLHPHHIIRIHLWCKRLHVICGMRGWVR